MYLLIGHYLIRLIIFGALVLCNLYYQHYAQNCKIKLLKSNKIIFGFNNTYQIFFLLLITLLIHNAQMYVCTKISSHLNIWPISSPTQYTDTLEGN